MLEILLLITAFLGSLASGIIDIKTTEIPDEIPYAMAFIGIIIHGINAYYLGNWTPILLSFGVGTGFFIFGFLMYYTGQWGGGDAKLLSALGFLLPVLHGYGKEGLFPFSLSLFFNIFLLGSIYMIIYSLVISFLNRRIWHVFLLDLKASSRVFMAINAVALVAVVFSAVIFTRYFSVPVYQILKIDGLIVLSGIGIVLLWKFAKSVENIGFKKRVPVSKLRVGDVLLESKVWEGLTKEQLEKIKDSGKKTIWIKEGVRFGPVFAIALVFTLVFGDVFTIIFGLI